MKKLFRSPITSIALFVVAAGLLVFSSIGGIRAALNIFSEDYIAQIKLDEIQVALTENGIIKEGYDVLLKNLIPEKESLVLGRAYSERLGVRNVGAIDEYVRVYVYHYWKINGEKAVNLDPSLIDLHFVTGQGWTIDEAASTTERTVLYYDAGLLPVGADSSDFTDTLTIKVGANTKAYEGAEAWIEAVVDSVQNHNGGDAVTSVWGHNFMGVQNKYN